MNKTITQKQAILLIATFIIGTSMLMVMGLVAKKDIWISILLAMAAASLIMLVYVRLLTIMPEKNFFETMEYFLGKVGGKIAIALITWFSLDLCAIVIRNYGQFVTTVGLKETPYYFIIAVMILACAYAVKVGIDVLGHWNEFFVFIIISFLLISILLVTTNMDINKILPVLDSGVGSILIGSLDVVEFPFAETVVFLLVFPVFKMGTSVKKVYLKGLLIGGLAIFLTSLTDVLVLGPEISETMYYPTYSTFSTVHIGDFIHRLEALAAIVFVISIFLKISIILMGTCNGVASIFNISDSTYVIMPVSFMVFNLAMINFDSMMYYFEWKKAFRYYSFIFEILVPIVILIIIQIRKRKMEMSKEEA